MSNNQMGKIAMTCIVVFLVLGIGAGVAININQKPKPLEVQPANSVLVQQPVNPNREYTLPGEKINMPFDSPSIVTVCNHGNRVYQSFYDTHSYGGVTFGFGVVPNDPTCPKDK